MKYNIQLKHGAFFFAHSQGVDEQNILTTNTGAKQFKFDSLSVTFD